MLQAKCGRGARGAPHDGPDVVPSSAVISACEKGTGWQGPVELSEEPLQPHLNQVGVVYSAATSACENGPITLARNLVLK